MTRHAFSRTVLLTAILLLLAPAAIAQASRDQATLEQLQTGEIAGPIPNAAFLPAGEQAPAKAPFAGTLVIEPTSMQMEPALDNASVMGRDATMFPGVELEFFSHDGELVPVVRDVITPQDDMAKNSFWQIIVQPGRVWSEPGDDGWSRASFPFALMNRLETDTHNGVATFLYSDGKVTDVTFQITQQTAPYYIATHFKAWGSLPASYQPTERGAYEEARLAYAVELDDRLPEAPWEELATGSAANALEGFAGEGDEFLVMSALVNDGTIYYQPSQTSQGPYPYPERMRFGVWSITKSVGPALGMLRLAEKYGDWVFDLELIDYLDINPPHDGWEGVTFGDALNMATGLGGSTVKANPNDMYVDYDFGGSYDTWYRARSEEEKVKELEKVGNYPWGPGLVARYRDRDMFALGVAMDAFLKSVEGDDADIWNMIADEVFEPIGIHHAPVNRTFEEGGKLGQPIMAWGWYPNLDDLAKVAKLLQSRGEHGGEQLLHRARTEALFSADGTLDQGPANATKYGAPRYKMGYHYVPFRSGADKELRYIPFMSGWIGNRVVPLPNGMTAIRISRAWPAPEEVQAAVEDPSSMIEAANRLEPFEK